MCNKESTNSARDALKQHCWDMETCIPCETCALTENNLANIDEKHSLINWNNYFICFSFWFSNYNSFWDIMLVAILESKSSCKGCNFIASMPFVKNWFFFDRNYFESTVFFIFGFSG